MIVMTVGKGVVCMRKTTKLWDVWEMQDPVHEGIDDRQYRYMLVEDGVIQDWEALFLDGVDEANTDEEEVEQ